MLRSLASRLLLTYLLVTALVVALAGLSLLVLLQSTPLADRLGWGAPEAGAGGVHPPGRGGVAQGETTDALDRRWLYVVRTLTNGDWLIIAAPRPTLRALLVYGDDLLAPLVQAALVGLAASVFLARLVSRWVTAPLRRLAAAARSVSAGRYEEHVPLEGPMEVESLAADLNQMVKRVQATQQGQGDFVANVSPEPKTPLTSIDGFAQAILDGTAADREAQVHAAHVIHEESDRLARLVDDLLALARLDAGQTAFAREPVDLNALVARVVDRLSLRAQDQGVRLENGVAGLPVIP